MLKPEQDDGYFANNIGKCILLNKDYDISIQISLPFVPMAQGDNN